MLLKIQHGGQLPSGKNKKHDISEIVWTVHSFIRGGGWPLAAFRCAFQPTTNAKA